MRFESVYVQGRHVTSDISWKAIPNLTTSKSKSTLPMCYVKRWHYKSIRRLATSILGMNTRGVHKFR